MRIVSLSLIISVLLLATMSLESSAEVAGTQYWIHGSWVNLRSGPAENAAVVTQLTTNTPIHIQARQGRWCEISTTAPATRGYVACELIGTKPLSIADLGSTQSPDGRPNPSYNAPRAFWIAPSITRLLQAGDFYWRTLLSDSQRASEDIDEYREPGRTQEKPVRFPVAEFDAMKKRLETGVVASPDMRPVMRLEESADREGLNPVRPSLFKRTTDLAPASSTVEQLSAQFGIVERVRILGGPEWAHHRHSNPHVFGHWDIGSLQVSLQQPVVEFVVGRQGLAAAMQWNAEETQDFKAEYYCTQGFSLRQRATLRLPDYPEVKDPLVWFFVPKALPYKKVTIKTQARRFGSTLQVLYEIDLDGDGISDLAVREMTGGPAMDTTPSADQGDMVVQRVTWANVSGNWYLLSADSYGECT